MKTRRKAAKDGETAMGAGAHFEASAAIVVPPIAALEKYRRHVAHLDLTEAAKTELLQAVWQMMGSFVDRAFGDDPVQQALATVDGSAAKNASTDPAVLRSGSNQHPDKTDLASAFTPSVAARRGRKPR